MTCAFFKNSRSERTPLFAPCFKLSAFVDDTGTCSLAYRSGRGEKQQDSHSEAHKMPKTSVLGDLIGSSIFN